MADIELVIKINEEDYKIMKHNILVNNPLCPLSQEEMVAKVANGVPLPKEKMQEPKKWHWILHIDDLFPAESTMECSACGEHQPLTISDSYCPNCGVKMESEVSE